MEKLNCKSCDIHLKLPNSLKKLRIMELKLDTDPSISYIQGKVKERSALHKNKWCDYMKVCLQGDKDDALSQIMVFVTGSIAKEMDVIQKDYTLVLTGFKIEGNSRIQSSSHPCQLVVDEDMTTPKVWYIEPEPGLVNSQEPSTSVTVNGQNSRVNVPDGLTSSTTKAVQSKKTDATKKVYSYSQLSSLKPNTVVDIYGVVKFFKAPSKTRGSDYSMLVTLVDPSLCEAGADKKLKCLLFHRDQAQLPSVDVGDIIRFHRLKVSMYNGAPQGQNSPGFSWLCVSGVASDPIEPKASSNNYSFTERDTEKIEELRCWQEKDQTKWSQEEKTRNKQIEDIVPGIYLDLICQVISVQVVDDTCVTFRVWDGTKTIYMVREMEADPNTHVRRTDKQLDSRVKDLAVEVALYDDHSVSAVNIQPGQFIKLCNLHAAILKNTPARDNMSALPTLELVLHRGTSFGRGLKFMEAESQDVLTLIDTLDRLAPPIGDDLDDCEAMDLFEGSMKESDSNSGAVEVQSIQESTVNSSTQQDNNNRKRTGDAENDLQNGSVSKRMRSSSVGGNVPQNCDQSAFDITSDQSALELSCDTSRNQSASPEIIDRCMLQTETVVLNHPHVKVTSIKDIQSHSVPYKFRILGRIEEYHPHPVQTPEDLVRLYCPQCHCLISLPKIDSNYNEEPTSTTSCDPEMEVSHVQAGIPYYRCPTCKHHPKGEPVDLIYTFLLRLLIRDDTGWIQANLWRDEAVVFFKDIDPRDVVSSQKIFRDVCDQLDKICLSSGRKKPLVECGVMSFSSGKGTGYHIFDTCVA
ncbi:protection of telomeres protein 1-like isoform X2 [Mizuhopecten yessoensis]|uniref:Protection of telomeres protein 1 n=1 Tax=Mizuhopecten yessoensis TaxID=6573 RepID=A0A210PF56_MIZYE|nr:protection of telomeres protein 1-like isoform X2 [Mizuhopecten yessoensis]OWF35118.1 Protection of telomeres protein 1 [Mizuhopecten yessoensis]